MLFRWILVAFATASFQCCQNAESRRSECCDCASHPSRNRHVTIVRTLVVLFGISLGAAQRPLAAWLAAVQALATHTLAPRAAQGGVVRAVGRARHVAQVAVEAEHTAMARPTHLLTRAEAVGVAQIITRCAVEALLAAVNALAGRRLAFVSHAVVA
jgi:hypothetical protein